ncbi:MAG: DNA repair protein RecO [Nannocystis sp.]|nr:DNA repair protein RecO [Nannocystis sp.]
MSGRGGEAEITPAIVLRTRPLGEADLLVVLLTPSGKVEAAATHARASKRRFSGGIHVGARGEATLSRGRGALLRLGAFEPLVCSGAIGQDLERFAFVAYVCEVTDELLAGREDDPRPFAALTTTLEALVSGAPQPAELRRFELALLDSLGLLPALDRCCVCGLGLSGPLVAFDGGRGGALCPAHDFGAAEVEGSALALARELLLSGSAVAALAAAPAPIRRALRDLCAGLVRAHLRRPLRSLAFLAQLPRPAVNPG